MRMEMSMTRARVMIGTAIARISSNGLRSGSSEQSINQSKSKRVQPDKRDYLKNEKGFHAIIIVRPDKKIKGEVNHFIFTKNL